MAKKNPAPKRAEKNPSNEAEKGILVVDSTRFRDLEVQKYYENNLNRGMNVEREFNFNSFGLSENFQSRRWSKLCQVLTNAAAPIVREFYANARYSSGDSKSWVRGKTVSYDSLTINKVYEIPAVGRANCAYRKSLLERWQDLEPQVTRNIVMEGADWSRRLGKPLKLLESNLQPQAKWVHKFVCTRLRPTTHQVDLNWNRGILIYTILTGEAIDVGEIIEEEISGMESEESDSVKFVFPSLITVLCEKAKVSWSPVECLKSMRAINQAKLLSSSLGVRKRQASAKSNKNQVVSVDQQSTSEQIMALTEQVSVMNKLLKEMHTYNQEQFAAIRAEQERLARAQSCHQSP